MYPTFTTARHRLPSILNVSEPLEQYRAVLDKRSLLRDAVAALDPLDAYLAHLIVDHHPGEPIILDLTSDGTAGAGVLLSLLHPREPQVLAVSESDHRAYRGVLEDYLLQQGKSLARLQWLSRSTLETELHADRDVLVVMDGSKPAVDEEAEQWLNRLPAAVVLVFGLGEVGDSPAIDALLRRFPSGSRRRFALLRDGGEVLSASRLGVVADRDNASAEVALRRVKQLFTSNYSFLGMLRSLNEQAIRSSESDAAVRENHVHFLDWNREINHLKRTAHEREDELRALQASPAYRLGEQLRRWRSRIAPDQTWRYRLFRRVHRAANLWRQGGLRLLLKRIAQRCLRRKA